jgi:hypothetical protein
MENIKDKINAQKFKCGEAGLNSINEDNLTNDMCLKKKTSVDNKTLSNETTIDMQNKTFEDKEIKNFYYIDKTKMTLNKLKDGRRVFHNKTELQEYDSNDPLFNQKFIEFRQLFFENLLLTENFKEEMKQPLTIQSALFSTFVYEDDFLEPIIQAFKLPSIIIRHREDVKYNQMEEHGNYIKYVFPKINVTLKWGKFHSKLMLFKFPKFLRVIIPSANLTNCDWQFWGQIIWFQDFPLKQENQIENEDSKLFREYLQSFMSTFMPHTYEGKRFWTDLEIDFNDYNFSNTCVDLFASANGRFRGNELNLYGIGRLHHLVNTKYKSIPRNPRLIIQCSSIGKSIKEKFFEDFYKGFNIFENKDMRKVEIIYPSINYITSFAMGEELTGCLFLTEDAYKLHKNKFKLMEVKEKYADRKTVFHSKIFITGDSNEKGEFIIDDNSIFYFGSHNFSAAAIGNFEKENQQVSTANYELGVIFNPRKLRKEEKEELFNMLLFNFNTPKYENAKDEQPYLNDFTQL